MKYEWDIPGFGLEDQALEAEYLTDTENFIKEVYYVEEIRYYPAWKQADGTIIAIKDMDTKHIKNCVKMIYKRNGTWRHQYLRLFENELRKRKYERTETNSSNNGN